MATRSKLSKYRKSGSASSEPATSPEAARIRAHVEVLLAGYEPAHIADHVRLLLPAIRSTEHFEKVKAFLRDVSAMHAATQSASNQITSPPDTGEWQRTIDRVMAAYSEDIIRCLANLAGTQSSAELQQLREFLRRAASVYLIYKNYQPPVRKLTRVRREFTALKRAYDRFVTQLHALSPEGRNRLWDSQWHDSRVRENITLDLDGPGFSYQFDRRRINTSALGDRRQYQTEDQSFGHLRDLGKRIETILRDLAPVRDAGGQSRNEALFQWCIQARIFWEQPPRKGFSHQKRAFDFCRVAVRRLQQNVPDRVLRTAMRSAKQVELLHHVAYVADKNRGN